MIPGTRVRLSALGKEANPDIANLTGKTEDWSNDGRTIAVRFDGDAERSWLRMEYVEAVGYEKELFW